MKYLDMIKNGEIPSEDMLLEIAQNGIDKGSSKDTELQQYIKLLTDALTQAQLQEESLLLIKTLFALENYVSRDEAFVLFVQRVIKLHVHKIPSEFGEFVKTLSEFYSADLIMQTLQSELKTLHLKEDEEFRSFFNWSLHIFWNTQQLLNNDRWTKWYEELKNLLKILIQQKRTSEVMYVEFFIYHIMGNSFQKMQEWREYNANVVKTTEALYRENTQNLIRPKRKEKEKKRIAFVIDRVVENSVFMVNYSFLKALKENDAFNDKYEIAVYTVNYFEKSKDDPKCINMIESLGVPFINPVREFTYDGYYNDHLEKAKHFAQTLLFDEMDIMIAGGAIPIIDYLYLARVAPLQIYYSHGNCAFDIEGIDKRVSHFQQECREFEWEIISVSLDQKFLVGKPEDKERATIIKETYKEEFGEDVVILGTIGRLIKIDSQEYLEVIAKIMQENPNTIYLACGLGNIDNIKEKLKKLNISEKRFIFTRQVNPHVYGWVIDVWPDTFPHGQGQSKDEFIAKKKPVMFHIKRGLHFDEFYLAKTDNEYIDAVKVFINNQETRDEVANKEYISWFSNKETNFLKVLND